VVYLCKQDRQAAILQAAARIALDEGLSATTVRRVACEARTAVGQVHHHFSSAASLRAKAYALVMRELQWDLEATSCHLPALAHATGQSASGRRQCDGFRGGAVAGL